jgi:hypothetical protein
MKQNIGEWSELLVIVKLLADQKITLADARRVPMTGRFIVVSKVNKPLSGGGYIRFVLHSDAVDIYDENDIFLRTVDRSAICLWASQISAGIEKGRRAGSSTFAINDTSSILAALEMADGFKSPSSSKTDIEVVVLDSSSGLDLVRGFSIKSYAGANSTLLNVSAASRVEYLFEGTGAKSIVDEVNSITGKGWLKKRGAMICERASLKGISIPNVNFSSNLSLIDEKMPEFYGQLLLASMLRGNLMTDCLDHCVKFNVLGWEHPNPRRLYDYKLKLFLAEIAMGMTPGHEWSGSDRMYGGFLFLSQSLEIMAISMNDRQEFENYLLNNTAFDTPSTSRHPQGEAILIDDHIRFVLNRQIRFIT